MLDLLISCFVIRKQQEDDLMRKLNKDIDRSMIKIRKIQKDLQKMKDEIKKRKIQNDLEKMKGEINKKYAARLDASRCPKNKRSWCIAPR